MLQAHVKEPQMVEINPFTTACVITCVLPCMLLLHNPTQFFHFARIKILLPWLVIKPATSQGCSNDMTAVRTFSHACCTCKAVARCLLTARVCDENVLWPFVIMLFYGKAHALHAVPSVSYSKTNGFSFLHVQELRVRKHLCLRSVVVFMSVRKLPYVLSTQLHFSASVPRESVECCTCGQLRDVNIFSGRHC